MDTLLRRWQRGGVNNLTLITVFFYSQKYDTDHCPEIPQVSLLDAAISPYPGLILTFFVTGRVDINSPHTSQLTENIWRYEENICC